MIADSSGGTSQVPVSCCNRTVSPREERRNPAGPILWGRPHTGHLSPSPAHPACADRCSCELLRCMDSFTPTSTFQYLPQSTKKGKTQIQHLFQTANPTGPVDVSSWVTVPASRRPQGLGAGSWGDATMLDVFRLSPPEACSHPSIRCCPVCWSGVTGHARLLGPWLTLSHHNARAKVHHCLA